MRSVSKSVLAECLKRALSKNNPKDHPDWGCYHHFSFIVQNDKILAWGPNMPGPARPSYSGIRKIHSEAAAYQRGRGKLTRGKPWAIVNLRLSKDGQLRISKPCHCCQSFLRAAGVGKIYFTTEAGFAQMEL